MVVTLAYEQFQLLLAEISPGRQGNFTHCNSHFHGERNTEVVEEFLAAVNLYKCIENIPDQEALDGVPLLLKGAAAVWWQIVKLQVTTWKQFGIALRHAFVPTIPTCLNYQQVVVHEQGEGKETPVVMETIDKQCHCRPEYQNEDLVLTDIHSVVKESRGITGKFSPSCNYPRKTNRQPGPTFCMTSSHKVLGKHQGWNKRNIRRWSKKTKDEPVVHRRGRGRHKNVIQIFSSGRLRDLRGRL
ncbi:uncharacterized protein LOC114364355 [Ostrinia furnacalis]|uniref:uncharacterized protein LOC114364355 n=1 Tax=Ostrinia furnacalis TaxID=93504 RepID=UPI00103D0DF8|nr:uncharacterized protein LOC114364355 [Ostrinia furnacalis]